MDLRIPETVLAIYGRSCVGKSTVASLLGDALRRPVRHCSDALRQRVERLNCSIDDAPRSIHNEVDEETRAEAKATPRLIVEGRFLDQVLAKVDNVQFVELTCGDAVREARMATRSSGVRSVADEDRADAAIRRLLYDSETVVRVTPLVVSTDLCDPSEVAKKIRLCLEGLQP